MKCSVSSRQGRCFLFKYYTWEHLTYLVAVLKIGHRNATVCNSIRTFFYGSKLQTVPVLWPLFGVHVHMVRFKARQHF